MNTQVYRILTLVLCLLPAGVARPASFDPQTTHAVIVGVLSWPAGSRLTPFGKSHRKDRELFDALARRGVPTNQMALLLDERATLAEMRAALRRVLAHTTPDSTFVFYYAGHGSPGVLENYDCAANGSFRVSEITATATNQFQGRNVLLLADCCNSGGLGAVARDLAAAGFQALSLTSADETTESTGNWTFTQTILDALNGNRLSDRNNDGVITVAETATEVAAAMKFREGQMFGYTLAGLPESWRLARANGTVVSPDPAPGEFLLKEYVRVPGRKGKSGRVGRIIGWEAGRYVVEFYDYTEKSEAALKPAQLAGIAFKTYAPGRTVTVSYENEPLPARVLRVTNDFHLISYLGWPGRHEEWVLADRILGDSTEHPPVRNLIFVEWQGSWWLAKIRKTDWKRSRYYIHYVGYGNHWDEWVTDARLKRIPSSQEPAGDGHRSRDRTRTVDQPGVKCARHAVD